MIKKKLPLILNIIVIISSLIGLIKTFSDYTFMSTSALYYYTIQSNILITIIMIIFAIYNLFNFKITQILYIIKYIFTIGITITFLVFLLMLTPQIITTGNIEYLFSITNLTLHFISPIISIISFIFFDNLKFNKKYYYLGLTMPLLYLIFSFFVAKINPVGIFKNFDGTTSKFPYFFLDYETNGWFSITNDFFKVGTFYWIIIIFCVILLISVLLLNMNNKRHK